ncbi:MAG: hypothetical protein MK238_09250 [Nitrospinales bacterium]|jgi:hypothetical protein|nr:hypothetical protein [SAR324 cluster bacterium]MCH2392705.1 hypothetical protein [Nitrospinales bacterium]|tara:strand:- start:436 stop:705 length:270 start_codon:yes stop_codon:yes gene_type:complete
MEKQFARLNSTLQELLINLREMNEKRSSQLNYIRDESVREVQECRNIIESLNKEETELQDQKEEVQKHIRDREILLNTFFEDDCFELFN